jgi:uncharacterized protein YndB with AHSA1/START domain
VEPLDISFRVEAPQAHAFETWTRRIDLWWPRSHTVNGDQVQAVVFEPRPGGRIFERTVQGNEVDWGEVTVWDPPGRLVYLWHLMFDRRDATEVEVTFTPAGEGTQVRILHRGWERLGAQGPLRRDRNRAGWGGVVPHYQGEAGRR